MLFNKISSAIEGVLPGNLSGEVRKNVNAAVQSVLEKMDLVTREEIEVQRKVLLRTRAKLENLESRITKLEESRDSLQH